MRASRLLSILITLQLRGRVTAREFSDRLEVSRRTILRDMEELSAAGVPIYADRGSQGGFALHQGYRTDLTGLDSTERDALFLVGLPIAAAELGLAAAAETARLKLAAAVTKTGTRPLDIADRFHLDAADWYRRATPAPSLRTVAEAVWTARSLRMDYESWRARRWRTVSPLGLVLKAGEWYLVAGTRSGPAMFRVAMIHAAEILSESFERPAGFDLAATWRSLMSAFEAGLRRNNARVRFAASAINRLDRLGADAADRVRAAAPAADGSRVASIPIESISHAAGLLLGFADEVEVIEPRELRAELLSRAARVQALYAGDDRHATVEPE